MDTLSENKRRVSKLRYKNVTRESDLLADPAYKVKREFYDNLKLKVQMNCNLLQQNAYKEAESIKDNLVILISQLPSRVQNMTVSDFCKEFGFELVDGNLNMMEDSNSQQNNAQTQVYRTVQMTRAKDYKIPQKDSSQGEIVSQLQIVHNGGRQDTFLRLSKNNISYDLTKQITLSASDRMLIQGEIAVFMQMLKDATPK